VPVSQPNFNASGKQGIKIIQTFVTKKIIVLMVASVYKWLGFSCLATFLHFASPQTGHSSLPQLPSKPVATHPYYISVVEINHNAGEKTLEISCKIFTNDFETTLEKAYNTKVDLVNPKDRSAMDKLIAEYIHKHFSISLEGKRLNYSYIGFEKEDEAIYSYFQVENVPAVKKIDVNDSILHDFSSQQINIVHCIVGGKRLSNKLDYPATTASFQF
jgi:hypothetical protein